MPAGRREEDGATRIESVAAEAVARVRRTRISVSVIAWWRRVRVFFNFFLLKHEQLEKAGKGRGTMSLTLWIRNDASDGPDEVRFRLLTEKTGSGFEICGRGRGVGVCESEGKAATCGVRIQGFDF